MGQPRAASFTRINYALAATLIAAGESYADVAPKVGAKNGESLRAGLSRKNVTLSTIKTALQAATPEQLRNAPVVLRVATAANDILREKSAAVRAKHAELSERVIDEIAKKPVPKSLKAQNLLADTLQKSAKHANEVFGWQDERSTALVVAGALSAAMGEAETIDLQPQDAAQDQPEPTEPGQIPAET